MVKSIAAVICNYNKSRYVTECIQSVLESKFTDFDIIVVDNASPDDSVKCIREKYGNKVTLLVNQENLGGSGGFNTGIRYAMKKEYAYVWCLDNDVLVDENAIGELYGFMEKNPQAGMAGSKIYHMEAPDYVQQFGINIDWEQFCCESKYYNRFEDGSMPDVVYSDAVAACSLLVRTSLIRKIGMLPEENFLYWDDTEWCYRCNLAGYKVASVGASKVLHAMGAKKEAVNTFPTYYGWRNWILFFIKYTREEKLERMCECFLESIFEIAYEGYYTGETNRMKTVMYAYDDAIHGVTGRAADNKIFEVDKNQEKLCRLLEGISCVEIKRTEADLDTGDFENKILSLNPRIKICHAAGSSQAEEPDEKNENIVCGKKRVFYMCPNIFIQPEYSDTAVFVDLDGRILENEEDFYKIFSKPYSRRSFFMMHKALFLERAKEIRKRMLQASQADGITIEQ